MDEAFHGVLSFAPGKRRCMGRLLVRDLLDRRRKDLVDGYGFVEEIWSLRKSKGEANVTSL